MITVDPFVFSQAVYQFWEGRAHAALQQRERGTSDQGGRSSVTAGRHMDGFAQAITELIVQAGVSPNDIYTRKNLELPGFFRPTKEWDIVIVSGGELRAAIELKSQVGPSFGNNFNNRTEEAMGSALDIWTAYREGAFGISPAPWLGYLLLLEDCPESRAPVKVKEPHFSVFEEYYNASYMDRYEFFCRKLVRERHYTAACFLTAGRTEYENRPNYAEPARDLSSVQFLTQLLHGLSR